MREIKGIHEMAYMSKHEVREYFSQYAEDFNTATLPSKKYYNIENWEREQLQKKAKKNKGKVGVLRNFVRFCFLSFCITESPVLIRRKKP